jgi:hypothetical protein
LSETALAEPRTPRRFADVVRLKTRLLTLGNLDKRTNAYRRTVDLISQMETDIGGDPTVGQRLLIQRAAVVAAMLEDLEAKWLSGCCRPRCHRHVEQQLASAAADHRSPARTETRHGAGVSQRT